MKALSDFIAIILFFATYSLTKNMVTATIVAVVVGIFQAAFTYWKEKKLEPMQWLSLVLIVVFGSLTIIFNDRTFIMLKTTILPWLMAIVMLAMQLRGKNGVKLLLKKEFTLPENVWNNLSYAWIIFFVFLGALNLFIAYPFTSEREQIWINFKLWGYMPISVLFSIAQGIYLYKHLPKEN
ncbi:septation protein A [Kingella negevensis]|uniref:septation protein A n=1 Tax=Kingella negevensis TaxID=1522312 RepID=UPI0025438DA0|nr:septation protein A [Kingella negevensis]WII92465.1 septation protein A [Kingella negevensis]